MKRFLLPIISILFLVAAFFASCDVGLGEAVDTEKPTVSIEYPPKNVVIKEDFVISGKCHDETSLKSVALYFQNSDTKNEYKFSATLSDDKNSWSADINKFDSESKKYPLPDGTYFVTAIATDGSGKTQEDKSTLRIDNTPPLLVLTNPSTVLDEKTPLESAGGFGATIKLQGSVNDFSVTDNDSGSGLVFTVFDENDKYLGRREMSNIPPSLGIIIGEYTDSTENLTDSNKFYNAIYGKSSEVVDTKYRKFKITVSDAARTYKGENSAANPTERGNTTECYYLKDEIYTDVINKFSVGYSEVYEIIKKQIEKTAELSENEKNILATLEQFKHDSDDEYEDNSEDSSRAATNSRALKIKPVGTFSLNPKNNPSYEITSIDAFDSSWEEKSISTSGNITLLAKCGLSDAPLDSATFKVILYKTDESGVRLAATDEDKNEDIEIPCDWTKNGANYTGRVTLSTKYVQVAQFYGIELKGQDKTGLEFYNGSKIYRFRVQIGTTPPDVKIETYSAPASGSTVYLKKKDSSSEAVDLVIKGTAESRSGSAEGYVTLWPVINGNNEQYHNKTYSVKTESNSKNAWSLTIPGKLFNDEKSDTYTVTIYAHDEIANETSKEIFVIFDKEDPKMQINSVNNVVVFDSDTEIKVGEKTFVAKADRGYVNETITLSGNVSDNDAFAKGTWKATCGGKEIANGSLSSSQIKFEIDTTKGSDGEELIINIEAFDRAGNNTSYEYKYDDGKTLVISQLTDYPRINLSNADSTVTTEGGVKIGHNLFDQTGNNRISGSIVDDDGIDTIEISYSEIGKNEFNPLYKSSLNADGKTSYSINQELKGPDGNALAEGFYKIKIVAKDKKTDSENANVKTTETEPFVVCINNGAPTITFTNPIKNTATYQTKNFSVKGSVSGQFDFSGDASDSILMRGNKKVRVSNNGIWEDEISYETDLSNNGTPAENSGIKKDADLYTITYIVTDRFDRTTTDTITFKSDFEPPVLTITNPVELTAYIGANITTLYSFKGTAKDTTLKSIEYSVDNGTNWNSITAQETWTANIDFKDFDSKDLTIQFRATDEANNVSDVVSRTVQIIKDLPKIEIAAVKVGSDEIKKSGDSVYYVKGDYKISGNVTSLALEKITGAGLDWTSPQFETNELNSSNSYTFTALDKAGQTSSVSINVVFDNEAPKIEISQVSPIVADYADTPKKYTNGAVNGTITIQGSASDNDKVVSAILKIYDDKDGEGISIGEEALQSLSFDGNSEKKGEAISIPEGTTNTANNFKFAVDTTKISDKFDNKGIVLRIVSTDRTGNEKFFDYPVYVCQETDKPVISFNNVKLTKEAKENLFGMGNNVLYCTVKDDDGIESISYTIDKKSVEVEMNNETPATKSFQIDISKIEGFSSGEHTLTVSVLDTGSVKNNPYETKIAYDDQAPVISVSKINEADYKENLWVKQNFSVHGNASDDSGVETVYLSTEPGNNLLKPEKDGYWSASYTESDGFGEKTFVAVDKFGRESSITIKYQIDTTPPEFINDTNSSEENLSKKIIIEAGRVTANTETLPNTWFGQTAVSVSGSVNEKNLDALYLNGMAFTASSSGKDNISTFKITNDFVEGDNSFTLKAKDKAGNENSIGPFSVLVDITPPNFKSYSIENVEENSFINNDSIKINFVIEDVSSGTEKKNGSGIKEIIISDTSAFNNVLAKWSLSQEQTAVPSFLEINAKEKLESKTYQLWIRAIDKAGNSTDISLPSFTYDRKAPEVKINTPLSNSSNPVNKTIELKGTVVETNLDTSRENKPLLYIYENSEWKQLIGADDGLLDSSIDSIGTSWTIKLDTTKISTSENNVEKAFAVTIKDKAGNITPLPENVSSAYKLVINQDSDRPVIYITNMDLSNMTSSNSIWHKQNTITGIVSDDDGAIKELYVSEQKDIFNGENLFKNGSWTYKFENNGAKDLYFKVVDSQGETFVSKASSDLNSPKIKDSKEQIFGEFGKDSVVHVKVDTKEPTIPDIRYITKDPSADLSGANAKKNAASILASDYSQWAIKGWKDINSISSDVFGGDTSKLYILIRSKDDNGIESLTGSLKDLTDLTKVINEGIVGKVNLAENEQTDDIRLIEFDIEGLASGTKTLAITAKDKASAGDPNAVGTTREFSVVIDNSAPVVKFNSHTQGASVYGTESVTIRGESSDSHDIIGLYLAVTKSETEMPEEDDWFSVSENTSVFFWTVLFDGKNNSGDTAHHVSILNDYINKLYGEGTADRLENSGLCIWAYAVDEYNNSGKNSPVKLPLKVITQGDKPTLEITYPENNKTIGGTITITGSTSIMTDSVSAVYVQIDPLYDKNKGFASDWASRMQAIIDAQNVRDYSIEQTGIESIGAAIKAGGSVQSWNLIINASKELNLKESGKDVNRTIAIRCYAVSSTSKKVSEPKEITFTLDPGSPIFGGKEPLKLVQYNSDGTEKASQIYEPEMWIKGEWYLTGSIEDDSGIQSFKINGEEKIDSEQLVKDGNTVFGNYYNYTMKIPVGSETGYGTISYKLEAFEGATDRKSTSVDIKLNYDNQAPVFKSTTLSESGNKIYQSDGVYEIKGLFLEDGSGGNQSGFSRIAFYFTRTLNGKTYIIDPMLQKGSDGIQNRYDIATEINLEKDLTNGLYWRKVENCKVSNGEEILLETLPSNVRKGGLCKINNVVYRIKNISGTTVTIDAKITNSDSVTIYFAIAQIIDNTIKETGKTTYYGDSTNEIINDDGDGMVESYSESSGEWTVAINTHNIFDGPVDIHFVAFDKAGNMTTSDYSGIVSNNTPRIAGIMLGTDLNGNNIVEDSELIKAYSGLYNVNSENKQAGVSVNGQRPNGEKVTSLDISDNGKAIMTIKGASKFIPEIVGGNTSLGWSYSVDGNEMHPYTEFASTSHSDTDSVRDISTTTINLTIEDFLNDSLEDGENKKFTFSIWDKTEGFIAGKDSQHADFNIIMNVAIKDATPPEVYIAPFYWNNKDDNSVYIDSDGTLKGHIELEEDWKQTAAYKNYGNLSTNAEYDADPKVSGIIYIEGTATDNVILTKLEMQFSGLNGNNDYITVAERQSNGSWKLINELGTSGIKFEIKENGEKFDNVLGNTIDYRIIVDTARISRIAASNVKVRMRATDRGSAKLGATGGISYTSGNQSVEAKVSTAKDNLTSLYQIDVVPYITGITTRLSSLKKNNPSVYARTALGHYAVAADEIVTVSGFNLTEGNLDVTKSISEITTSGEFAITVNGIKTLNNENNNDGRGAYLEENTSETGDYNIYKNYYNRQPNNDSNNLLTDDVYFDIWQFNSEAAKPINGAIDQPIMKIDPKTGVPGFAFANGSLFFSMGGTVKDDNWQYTYSAAYWMGSFDFFSSIGFAYDDLGYSYGTAAGGDCNASEGDAWCFVTSRWGLGARSQRGSYDGRNNLRLERIGQKEGSSYIINKQRIKSPSIVTAVHGNSTNVYLAYYDVMNDEIRFKYGSTNSTDKMSFGNFSDSATSSNGTTRGENVKYVNLLAGGNTGRNAGDYVSLGVVPGTNANNDVVVAMWYDSTSRCLKYAYNSSPLNSSNGASSGSEWQGEETVFTGDMATAGEYCEVMVDKDGGIHIAAYDPTNLDLVYAYKSKYSNSGFETCIVDSNGVVGSNLTLDVAKVDGVWTPYIGYYATTCVKPKLAYKVSSENMIAGAKDDLFTGDWECTIVPTGYSTPLGSQGNNKMNVGVWKDISTWTLKNSTKGTEAHSHTVNGYNSTCTDTVYANGTKNPLMGYAIKINGSTTYIETAQLK